MNFKDWLQPFIGIKSPIGDLAKDIYDDYLFPNTDDAETIFNYLDSKHLDKTTLNSVLMFYLLSTQKAHIKATNGLIDYHSDTNPFLYD